jgi:hypothetical protein
MGHLKSPEPGKTGKSGNQDAVELTTLRFNK